MVEIYVNVVQVHVSVLIIKDNLNVCVCVCMHTCVQIFSLENIFLEILI